MGNAARENWIKIPSDSQADIERWMGKITETTNGKKSRKSHQKRWRMKRKTMTNGKFHFLLGSSVFRNKSCDSKVRRLETGRTIRHDVASSCQLRWQRMITTMNIIHNCVKHAEFFFRARAVLFYCEHTRRAECGRLFVCMCVCVGVTHYHPSRHFHTLESISASVCTYSLFREYIINGRRHTMKFIEKCCRISLLLLLFVSFHLNFCFCFTFSGSRSQSQSCVPYKYWQMCEMRSARDANDGPRRRWRWVKVVSTRIEMIFFECFCSHRKRLVNDLATDNLGKHRIALARANLRVARQRQWAAGEQHDLFI